MAGLAREPSKRPATVEEFAEEVAKAAANGEEASEKGGLLGVFKSIMGKE